MFNLVYPPEGLEGNAINLDNIISVQYSPGSNYPKIELKATITFYSENQTTHWIAQDFDMDSYVKTVYENLGQQSSKKVI